MSRRYYFGIPDVANPTTTPFLQLASGADTELVVVEIFIAPIATPVTNQVTLYLAHRSTASTLPNAATAYPTTADGIIIPVDQKDAAPQGTLSTTAHAYGIATATGTLQRRIRLPHNLLSGELWTPVPEMRPQISGSNFFTLQFNSAPPAVTVSGYVAFEEP